MKSLALCTLIALSLVGCGRTAVDDNRLIDTLALPNVPDTLMLPVLRADYVAEHFWDAMGDVRRELWLDTMFMEQNFVNFASVLPHTSSEEAVHRAAEAYVSAFAADSVELEFAMHIAENYLTQRESAVYNEMAYVPFAQAYLAKGIGAVKALHQAYLMRVALLNAPGQVIADVKCAGGTLHTMLSKQCPTLIMFYDPECDNCRELRQRMREDAALLQGLCIIEISADDVTDDSFVFNGMPSLYLVDTDSTVILKDCTYDQLLMNI